MKEKVKKLFKDKIFLAILLIIIGLILIIFPLSSLSIGSLIIAGIVCVSSLAYMIYFFIDKGFKVKIDTLYFILALLGLIISIYTFIKPNWLIIVLNYVVGILLIVNAAYNLRYLLKNRVKNTIWWIFLVLNIIVALLGVIAIINPIRTATIFITIEGIFLVFGGVMNLIITHKLISALN